MEAPVLVLPCTNSEALPGVLSFIYLFHFECGDKTVQLLPLVCMEKLDLRSKRYSDNIGDRDEDKSSTCVTSDHTYSAAQREPSAALTGD